MSGRGVTIESSAVLARTVKPAREVVPTSEPTASSDAVDRTSDTFWQPADLHTILAGAEPLREDESFTIPDLTDEEWEAFTRARRE